MKKSYSENDLIKFLSLANKKLKAVKKNIKNVRIERNYYKKKLEEIEYYLNNYIEPFSKYDHPSNSECDKLYGKMEVKQDLLDILKK